MEQLLPYGAMASFETADMPTESRAQMGLALLALKGALLLDEQQQQIDQLRQASLTDELTELLNERGIMQELNQWIEEERHFGLLYIDLTNFKRLNDEFGHNEGDLHLQSTAGVLRHVLRAEDRVSLAPENNDPKKSISQSKIGRPHGDEFLVLVDLTPEGLETIKELKYVPKKERRGSKVSLQERILDTIAARIQSTFDGYLDSSNLQLDNLDICIGRVVFNPAIHANASQLIEYGDFDMQRRKKIQHQLIGAYRS